MGGTARLSVQVDAAWRVHVLVAELASRGLAASWEPTEGERHAVRTSYTRVLKPLAAAWLHGTAKRPPAALPPDRPAAAAVARRRRDAGASGLLPAAAGRRRPGVLGADRRRRSPSAGWPATLLGRPRAARRTGSPAAAGWRGSPSWSATDRAAAAADHALLADPAALDDRVRRSVRRGFGGRVSGRVSGAGQPAGRSRRKTAARPRSWVRHRHSDPLRALPRCTVAPSGSAERGAGGVDRRVDAVCRPRNPERGRRVTLDIRTAGATAGRSGRCPGAGRPRAGVRSGRDVPSNAGTTRLVIVESPAKAKTISGYLGPGYVVEASFGHVRDLPRNAADVPAKYKSEPWARLGVDVDNGFHAALRRLRRPQAADHQADEAGQGGRRDLPGHG